LVAQFDLLAASPTAFKDAIRQTAGVEHRFRSVSPAKEPVKKLNGQVGHGFQTVIPAQAGIQYSVSPVMNYQ
jgi:hypothetical protein